MASSSPSEALAPDSSSPSSSSEVAAMAFPFFLEGAAPALGEAGGELLHAEGR